MIALDTNLLVYAHRADNPFHEAARAIVEDLVNSSATWALPWPCVHEFIAIVTHPRIYRHPTALSDALQSIGALAALPNARPLAEGPGYFAVLERCAAAARVVDGAIHDARIAALCLHHGVSELWSADRDFSRYPELRIRNPLISPR